MLGPCPWLTRTLGGKQASRQLCSFWLLPGDLPLTQAPALASMAPSEIWPLLFQQCHLSGHLLTAFWKLGVATGHPIVVCRENLTWVQVLTLPPTSGVTLGK